MLYTALDMLKETNKVNYQIIIDYYFSSEKYSYGRLAIKYGVCKQTIYNRIQRSILYLRRTIIELSKNKTNGEWILLLDLCKCTKFLAFSMNQAEPNDFSLYIFRFFRYISRGTYGQSFSKHSPCFSLPIPTCHKPPAKKLDFVVSAEKKWCTVYGYHLLRCS